MVINVNGLVMYQTTQTRSMGGRRSQMVVKGSRGGQMSNLGAQEAIGDVDDSGVVTTVALRRQWRRDDSDVDDGDVDDSGKGQ